MEFEIQKRELTQKDDFQEDDLELAYKFTNRVYKEFGDFLRAVVIFGSAARKEKSNDLDILLIVDDVSLQMTADVAETYRILLEKIVADISTRLHVTSLKLSSFWEYIRVGDPVGVNILRDGMPLMDTGVFKPLQLLLRQGRIRPSPESIWTYFARAPKTLHNSKWHILQAIVDLYWAVIDSAHAALMKLDEMPPSPEHVADALENKMVKKGHLDQKYADTMRKFYKLSKEILHRKVAEMPGEEYDKLFKEAEDFVNTMKSFIDWTCADFRL